MKKIIKDLIDRIESNILQNTDIIPWGAPVPVFGDITQSKVATLGLNPSNLEFTDNCGNELIGEDRRFHTLSSLKISSWKFTNEEHIKKIIESYKYYFFTNPYDRWFRSLDIILKELDVSYYNNSQHACHLDLVPYATKTKWGKLSTEKQRYLISSSCDGLASLLSKSPIRVLILNGASVVNHFLLLSSIDFKINEMPSWTLCRDSKKKVKGYSYMGELKQLMGYKFNQEILVLGFNHNIQSSFGVTNQVKHSIAKWIKLQTKETTFEF